MHFQLTPYTWQALGNVRDVYLGIYRNYQKTFFHTQFFIPNSHLLDLFGPSKIFFPSMNINNKAFKCH